MKIKRAVRNLLILVSPGGTAVCTGDKFLKIGVSRLAKIGFLTHFFVICYQTKPTFLSEYSQIIPMRCIIDAFIKNTKGASIKYVRTIYQKSSIFYTLIHTPT